MSHSEDWFFKCPDPVRRASTLFLAALWGTFLAYLVVLAVLWVFT